MALFDIPTGAKRSAPLPTSLPSAPPVVAAAATDPELPAGPRAAQYVENLLISSVISASGLTVKESKPALSIQQTTIQFRRFVEKAGPVFRFQDAAEKIVTWENPLVTMLVGAIYAFLCVYPLLLLLLPNLILIAILLSTYSIRQPKLLSDDPTSVHSTPSSATLELTNAGGPTGPPIEGSIDYVSNLQDIQVMMSRVADLTDAGRSLVPYLDWSQPRTSLVLLQIATVTTIPIGLALPYLPLRMIALFGGLGALLAAHPVSIALLSTLGSTPSARQRSLRLAAWVQTMIRHDALDDAHLDFKEHELRRVEVFENERLGADGWSSHALTVRDPPPWSGGGAERARLGEGTAHEPSERIAPPAGFAWIPGDGWMVDRLGQHGAELDAAGWLYFDNHSRRQRRWIRRCGLIGAQ